MIEKQRALQAKAFEEHKRQQEEEEKKKADAAAMMGNDREARIDINDLQNNADEFDIDDL